MLPTHHLCLRSPPSFPSRNTRSVSPSPRPHLPARLPSAQERQAWTLPPQHTRRNSANHTVSTQISPPTPSSPAWMRRPRDTSRRLLLLVLPHIRRV
jgi:hypothetical protein